MVPGRRSGALWTHRHQEPPPPNSRNSAQHRQSKLDQISIKQLKIKSGNQPANEFLFVSSTPSGAASEGGVIYSQPLFARLKGAV